jgi:GNAT superfamily N-acetyltransferase
LSFLIREAEPKDAPAILRLIKALAEYEKMLDDVQTDEARIGATLFGERPRAFCDIAEVAGEPVGYAIWLYSYSTFSGRHGIYLEDLFVLPEHRGAGIGKALLQGLAKRCIAEGLGRLDWAVLDWNDPSIGFYRSLGAKPSEGWTSFGLRGDALAALGNEKT